MRNTYELPMLYIKLFERGSELTISHLDVRWCLLGAVSISATLKLEFNHRCRLGMLWIISMTEPHG